MIFRRAAASGALLLALMATPAMAGSWRAPLRLTTPRAADLGPAQVAVSPTGELAVAFTVFDEDNPSSAQAFLALRGPRGRKSIRSVPAARQVLGLAFSGTRLELLTGSAPADQQCCTQAAAVSFAGGAFGPAHTLSDQLTGPMAGRLAVLKGGEVLAAFATDRAVWQAQWRVGTPPRPASRISFARSVPWTLAGAQTASGDSALAWIGADDRTGEQGARRIAVAFGSAGRPPHGARLILTAGTGHELDQLALAPDGDGLSAAWTDGWFDRGGAYQSQVVVADLAPKLQPRPLPVAGQSASGAAFAGGGAGEQVLAFKSCDAGGSCWVRAAFRDPGGRFGSPVQLGTIDTGQDPDAAVTGDGSAIVAWISRGHVFAVTRAARAGRPGPVREVSATNYASNVQTVAGSRSGAIAVWTQGTLNVSVVGALNGPAALR